jgi:hypothetical protein
MTPRAFEKKYLRRSVGSGRVEAWEIGLGSASRNGSAVLRWRLSERGAVYPVTFDIDGGSLRGRHWRPKLQPNVYDSSDRPFEVDSMRLDSSFFHFSLNARMATTTSLSLGGAFFSASL